MVCNFDEWVDYFESKYNVPTIVLCEVNVEKIMRKQKSGNTTIGLEITRMSWNIVR
ncbi:MAG: hypothetical protein LBF68_06045 [Christensenellaceae bacterium]|nr:hypothetical protein [Christensenellaceae bacterium]